MLPSECRRNFSYLIDMVIVSHGFSVASIQTDGSIFDYWIYRHTNLWYIFQPLKVGQHIMD
jgi:hypothetical protein